MKICIPTTDPNLSSPIDQVFGRCGYFLIVDSESEKFKIQANKAKEAERGAGIQASQTVVDLGAEVVICSNIGPNALSVLQESGVKVISGVSGTAKEALEKFKSGELK